MLYVTIRYSEEKDRNRFLPDGLCKHNWQERVRIWDVQRSREALSEVIIQRNKELIDFINEDFSIAKQKLMELEESEELNAHQYRQIMMGYREAREFLKELIGIFEANFSSSSLCGQND